MKFGAHVSIAGGVEKAPDRAYSLGCECFQIFTRSPRGGKATEIDRQTADSFLKNCEQYNFSDYYAHTPYIVNLASSDKDLRVRSIQIIREDLERSSLLGVRYIMTHLGSSRNTQRKQAIENIIDSVNRIHDSSDFHTKLLLENSAGQGETIGEKFEEISAVLDRVEYSDIHVCLDTAHMFAAGYDIRNADALDQTMNIIDNLIGTERIKLIHGNDSRADIGQRKDRHEHIGRGKIGLEAFRTIINCGRLKNIDMIVENPPEGVEEDIRILKHLRDQ